MSAGDIEVSFPKLVRRVNYDIASPEDFSYNCLAFVAGDRSNWWEPSGSLGFYWPPGFDRDETVETAVKIIAFHGFAEDLDIHGTAHADSVAIYAKGNEWTHFARFIDGNWKSKLGEDHNIWHSSLDVLEGEMYGQVARIMSKKI